MRSLRLACALPLILAACDPAPGEPVPGIDAGPWPAAWAAIETAVLEETNRNRASGATCGGVAFAPTAPLSSDDRLQLAARLHSLDMATQDYFSHTSLDGRTYQQRMMDASFFGDAPRGENIAAGPVDAASVVQGWMESPEHCANIMDPEYFVIGIGYAFDEASSFDHYWTQDFAASH